MPVDCERVGSYLRAQAFGHFARAGIWAWTHLSWPGTWRRETGRDARGFGVASTGIRESEHGACGFVKRWIRTASASSWEGLGRASAGSMRRTEMTRAHQQQQQGRSERYAESRDRVAHSSSTPRRGEDEGSRWLMRATGTREGAMVWAMDSKADAGEVQRGVVGVGGVGEDCPGRLEGRRPGEGGPLGRGAA
ncbi:hypothetical protein DFH09DRAFT_1446338 [Mycena vulgaris]|nr:hypothetical protein DFH09DRAFT_1446338 [Mycena vulgaris]